MSVSIRWHSGTGDLKGFAAGLGRASGRVGAESARVVRAGAAKIVRDAKIAAPVDTGNLRASIGSTITGDGRGGTMTAEIGPSAHYGIYVELGTSRMAPQPYLFPAFDSNVDAIIDALSQAAIEALAE